VAGFSRPFALAQLEIKQFLFARMYRHRVILPVWKNAERIVRSLFGFFMREPDAMGEEWAQAAKGAEDFGRARLVADYIAGMTDRYALKRAEALLGPQQEGGGECAD
jgi:dGTPase